jgi:hypothetical protein
MKAIAPDDSLKWKEEGIVREDAIEKLLKKRGNAAVNHGSPFFMIWMLFIPILTLENTVFKISLCNFVQAAYSCLVAIQL